MKNLFKSKDFFGSRKHEEDPLEIHKNFDRHMNDLVYAIKELGIEEDERKDITKHIRDMADSFEDMSRLTAIMVEYMTEHTVPKK